MTQKVNNNVLFESVPSTPGVLTPYYNDFLTTNHLNKLIGS